LLPISVLLRLKAIPQGGSLQRGRINRGEVHHQGNSYPGEHEAIIDQELWEAVQQRLAANRTEQRSGTRAESPSLLAGLVRDEAGERLVPTHAVKGGRRYRYYVSRPLQADGKAATAGGMRIPAGDLERVVMECVRRFLTDRSAVFAAIRTLVTEGAEQRQLLERAIDLAGSWSDLTAGERRAMLHRLLTSVAVHPGRIELCLRRGQLAALLADRLASLPDSETADDGAPIALSVPVALKRAGLEMRLLVEGAAGAAEPDPALIKLVVKAQQLRDKLLGGESGIGVLPEREGLTSSYFTRVVRLGFLAPDIIAAILDGRQPAGLTANKLLLDSQLPLTWSEQRRVLGFR
jgi:hypothetical protein